MINKFDTYLFDFDGTLVDTHESLYKVFLNAYRAVGVEITYEDVVFLMRVPLLEGYQKMGAPLDEEHVKIYCDEIIRLLDDEEVLSLSKTYDEVKEVLYTLHKEGKKLGIVTSNSRKHVGDVLRYIGLDESLFEVIVGNKETKKHKPNPDPILKTLEILNISNEGVCYVGDGMDDMRCAVNAHVGPIHLDRDGSQSESPYPQIKTLKELL